MSEEQQEEVLRQVQDALPDLCRELGRHHDEVEPEQLVELLGEYGLELRTAAPLEAE